LKFPFNGEEHANVMQNKIEKHVHNKMQRMPHTPHIWLIERLIEVFCLTVPNFWDKQKILSRRGRRRRLGRTTRFMARNEFDKIAEHTGLRKSDQKIFAPKKKRNEAKLYRTRNS
jgi:hypothetical protein